MRVGVLLHIYHFQLAIASVSLSIHQSLHCITHLLIQWPKCLQMQGRGLVSARWIFKSSFRLLSNNPRNFNLLGIKIEGKYYIDKCLPIGCSVSCKVFEEFATFLQCVVKQKTCLSTIDHYLDDVIFAGNDFDTCSKLMEMFKQVAQEFGVPLAADKCVGPTNNLVF